MTRVFQYWCEPADKETALAFNQQSRRGWVYRRALAASENTYRARYRELDLSTIAVARKQTKLEALRRYAAQLHERGDQARLKIAQDGIARVKQQLREIRAERRQEETYRAQIKSLGDARVDAVREGRGEASRGGLYWGTYLTIERAHEQACEMTAIYRDLRAPPPSGGAIGVQIQRSQPLTTATVFSGEDTRVRLGVELYALQPVKDGFRQRAVGPSWKGNFKRGERLRELQIRVCSDGRKPVWGRFHVLMHRPLPSEARITWVRVYRKIVGLVPRYNVQFTVEEEAPTEVVAVAPVDRVCGIDLGWRKVEGGWRVAYLMDDRGETHELIIPDQTIRRQGKCEDLRSIRDKMRDAFRARLSAFRKELVDVFGTATAIAPGEASTPEEAFILASQSCHLWCRVGRFVQFHRIWAENRVPGDDALFAAAEAWLKQDRHLLFWERNNDRRMRFEINTRCQQWAAEVAKQYRRVGVENFSLAKLRARDEDEDDTFVRALTAKRTQIVAPGEFRKQIEYHVTKRGGTFISAPTAFSTQDCGCGHRRSDVSDWNPLEIRCSACGLLEDQDKTAARNLCAFAVASGDVPAPDGAPLAAGRAENASGKKKGRFQRRREDREKGVSVRNT